MYSKYMTKANILQWKSGMWNVYMHEVISSFTEICGNFVLSTVHENWQKKILWRKIKLQVLDLIFQYNISNISVYGWPKCGQQIDEFVGGYCEG